MKLTQSTPLLHADTTRKLAYAGGQNSMTVAAYEFCVATHFAFRQVVVQRNDLIAATAKLEAGNAKWREHPEDFGARRGIDELTELMVEKSQALAEHLPRLEALLGISGLIAFTDAPGVPEPPAAEEPLTPEEMRRKILGIAVKETRSETAGPETRPGAPTEGKPFPSIRQQPDGTFAPLR